MNTSENREMKSALFFLGYFKQGDDMANFLKQSGGDVAAALQRHAEAMDEAARLLRALHEAIAGHDVTIEADTHVIEVHGPAPLIDRLIAAGVLDDHDFDEDEDVDDEPDQQEVEENDAAGGA